MVRHWPPLRHLLVAQLRPSRRRLRHRHRLRHLLIARLRPFFGGTGGASREVPQHHGGHSNATRPGFFAGAGIPPHGSDNFGASAAIAASAVRGPNALSTRASVVAHAA